SIGKGGVQLYAALFFTSGFLLVSSGRLGSSDVYGQLQASMLFATTGHLSASTPPSPTPELWVKSPGGRYFEAHDIGNTLLFLPAAWVGSVVDRSGQDLVTSVPLISRVASALTYAVLSAAGGVFLFKLLGKFHPPQTAFVISVLIFL